MTPEGKIDIRILSAGDGWDHFYFIYKKSHLEWQLLKTLQVSWMENKNLVQAFDYKKHHFLVLFDVQDHGFPWFAIANYRVFLMDKGMEEVGQFISYGDQDSFNNVLGRMTYEGKKFSSPPDMRCPLELDVQIDFEASFNQYFSKENEKYNFDDFKAFLKIIRLYYDWDNRQKNFYTTPN